MTSSIASIIPVAHYRFRAIPYHSWCISRPHVSVKINFGANYRPLRLLYDPQTGRWELASWCCGAEYKDNKCRVCSKNLSAMAFKLNRGLLAQHEVPFLLQEWVSGAVGTLESNFVASELWQVLRDFEFDLVNIFRTQWTSDFYDPESLTGRRTRKLCRRFSGSQDKLDKAKTLRIGRK